MLYELKDERLMETSTFLSSFSRYLLALRNWSEIRVMSLRCLLYIKEGKFT